MSISLHLLFRGEKTSSSVIRLLTDEYEALFPDCLIGENEIEGAKAVRQSIVANILERRFWQSEVSFRRVTHDDGERGLYYTWDGPGINPISEIDEVKDVEPDSPFGKVSNRFRKLEDDLDDEVSDLDERVSRLEYRIREELGSY